VFQDSLKTLDIFVCKENPTTGVKSYILDCKSFPVIQNFYFVNNSFTDDGKTAWFYAGIPGKKKKLGFVDFQNGICKIIDGTEFLDASPWVDPISGEAYWIEHYDLLSCSPKKSAVPKKINSIPYSITQGREPYRIATHLTLNASKTAFNFDAELEDEWIAGKIPLDGSEPIVWKTFNICYNHGQFSPVDDNLMLIAQDGWNDQSGQHHDYDQRMWLLRKNGECKPLYNEPTRMHGHEWWGKDGEYVCFVHYGEGVKRININTKKEENLWQGSFSHAHASADLKYLVADADAGGKSPFCKVIFFNRDTNREIEIVNIPWCGDDEMAKMHVHPHPRFVFDDEYICYTSFALGRPSLAITNVNDLIKKTV
jgi:hypothetical protein